MSTFSPFLSNSRVSFQPNPKDLLNTQSAAGAKRTLLTSSPNKKMSSEVKETCESEQNAGKFTQVPYNELVNYQTTFELVSSANLSQEKIILYTGTQLTGRAIGLCAANFIGSDEIPAYLSAKPKAPTVASEKLLPTKLSPKAPISTPAAPSGQEEPIKAEETSFSESLKGFLNRVGSSLDRSLDALQNSLRSLVSSLID